MNAGIVELLTFGDELLDGRRVDTNTSWLGRRLTAMGIPPRFRQTTTDRREDIVRAFLLALSRARIIITTGGLGPTADDLTFEALAEALDRPLTFHPHIFEHIQARFQSKGLQCPDSNRRQAMLPEGAAPLPNLWGTAPGLFAEHGTCSVFCLPGVPSEMRNIFDASVVPELQKKIPSKGARLEKIYSFVGLGESLLEEYVDRCELQNIPGGEVRIAYTASFPQVDVTLSVSAQDRHVQELMEEAHRRLLAGLGEYLVSEDGESLEHKISRAYIEKKWTLSVAESMTGGMISAKLIDVPGSSAMFERGWVTYSNASKVEELGVSPATLTEFGAVSRECAIEMALGAKIKSGSHVGLATTGIAGPSGGNETKPVGLCYIACVGPKFESLNSKEDVWVSEHRFRWDRNRNRLIAATEALKMLLRVLSP